MTNDKMTESHAIHLVITQNMLAHLGSRGLRQGDPLRGRRQPVSASAEDRTRHQAVFTA